MEADVAPIARASMPVTVVYSPRAGAIDETALELRAGATLVDALRASGILERHPGIDLARPMFGIWGRSMPLEQPLKANDRVEVYRPLAVDPKEARRRRQRAQRALRTTSSSR
jgi:putative ubiquitin-RnfH superfamily antitoxin RatB of RatAB toxin-antitoxin module